MKRKHRLTRSADFERVRRLGKSYAHPLVVLIVLQNDQDHVRVGIAASRSIGGAVQRNRAKRILRAGIQPHLEFISDGIDILLIARRPITKTNSTKLETEIGRLLKKAHEN
ncbi:MAG: ribonuclease P protein component [Chloroflexota bacterium]